MSKDRKLRLSRRDGLALGGMAAVAAACGVGGYLLGTRDPDDREDQPTRDRPLRILSGQDDTVNGQRLLLIDEWNTRNPDLPAEMIELPNVADLQYSEIHATLQARDSSVDIVNLDVPWIAEFASRGYLLELEDVDTSGFLERPLKAGRFDGRLYALPFNTDTGMLYYRERPAQSRSDLANGFVSAVEASHIANWAGLRHLMEDILRASRDSATAAKFKGGIAMQLASYEGFTVNVWEYLLANGAEPDAAGMIDFGDGDVIAHLAALASELRDDDTADVPSLILGASLHHQEEESLRAFMNGDTPFLRHWPRAYLVLSCEADFPVGMVPMPGTVLGGQSLAVSAFSERQGPARRLVAFLTGDDSQRALFEHGGFAATREDMYADAEGTPSEEDASSTPGDCETTGNLWPDVGALHAALTGEAVATGATAIAGARPTVERYTQFSRAFREFLHPQIENSPDPSLGDLKATLDAALSGR